MYEIFKTCKSWFDGTLDHWLQEFLQFVFDQTGWDVRQCLPYAEIIMFINYFQLLCLEAKDEAGETDDFPGARFLKKVERKPT